MSNEKVASKPTTRTLEGPREFIDRALDMRAPKVDGRVIGAGKACDDPSQIAASIVDGLNCGIEDLEVVAENRAFFEGALIPTNVANLFTPKINPFTIGTNVGAVDQAQINIDGAEMDCNVLITHVYFHMVPPKELMLVEGGFLAPAPTVAGNVPVVADTWLKTDAATDGSGTLGLTAGQTLTKAYLDVGEWACDGFYDMCRAYEWIWKIGNNILMQAPLTKIASIRGSAQAYTSGRSRKPFAQYVRDANDYLRANSTASGGGTLPGGVFLPRNATQSGTITDAHTTPGVKSLFQEYGYFEEEVTFGGPGVQELCMNPTVYELCTAQLFPRGVKLGMYFNLIDTFAQARAGRAFNAFQNGGNPIVPDVNVTTANFVGSGALPVFDTLTSDIAGPAQAFQQQPIGTMAVKIGDFYLVAGLMGHRVSQTLYQKAIANESAVCDAVTAGTFGKRSLSMMAGK